MPSERSTEITRRPRCRSSAESLPGPAPMSSTRASRADARSEAIDRLSHARAVAGAFAEALGDRVVARARARGRILRRLCHGDVRVWRSRRSARGAGGPPSVSSRPDWQNSRDQCHCRQTGRLPSCGHAASPPVARPLGRPPPPGAAPDRGAGLPGGPEPRRDRADRGVLRAATRLARPRSAARPSPATRSSCLLSAGAGALRTLVRRAAARERAPGARRRRARHADRRRRRGHARGGFGPRADRLAARGGAARAPTRERLHRRLPARGGRAARRAPRHHALVRLRRARAPLPARPGRAGSDLRARRHRLYVGGCHRRHGSRPRAGRGGSRARARARRGALAGAVPQAAGRAVAVQRAALRPAGLAPAAPGAAGVDRRERARAISRWPRSRRAPA